MLLDLYFLNGPLDPCFFLVVLIILADFVVLVILGVNHKFVLSGSGVIME